MQLSPQVMKLVGKGALMIAGSAVIGFVVKAEEHLKDRVNERYAKKDPEEPDDSEN